MSPCQRVRTGPWGVIPNTYKNCMGLEIQTGYLNSHYSSLEFRAVANGHLYFQTLQTFNRSVKPRYINLVKSLQKCTHSFTPPTSGYSEKKGTETRCRGQFLTHNSHAPLLQQTGKIFGNCKQVKQSCVHSLAYISILDV